MSVNSEEISAPLFPGSPMGRSAASRSAMSFFKIGGAKLTGHFGNSRPATDLCQSDTGRRLHGANARPATDLRQSDTERRLRDPNSRPATDLCQSDTKRRLHGANARSATALYQSPLGNPCDFPIRANSRDIALRGTAFACQAGRRYDFRFCRAYPCHAWRRREARTSPHCRANSARPSRRESQGE
jgi:hypothetical protein